MLKRAVFFDGKFIWRDAEMPQSQDGGIYLPDRMTIHVVYDVDGKPDMVLARPKTDKGGAGPIVFEEREIAQQKADARSGKVKTMTFGAMVKLALRNKQTLYIVLSDGIRYVVDLTVPQRQRRLLAPDSTVEGLDD